MEKENKMGQEKKIQVKVMIKKIKNKVWLFLKKIYVMIGNYGSGKSELALNFAMQAAARGDRTELLDLDMVNTYFRLTERGKMVEQKEIRLVSPNFACSGIETLSLPAEVSSAFVLDWDTVIFDVGGDDVGATALGRYHQDFMALEPGALEVLNVVNIRRPLASTVEKIHRLQEGMQAHGGWNALFWCNHDQPRAVSRFGSDTTYWKESAEMLAVAIHFMRGTPYIYQGEELGMTNPHFTKIEQYRDVESLNYYRILREQDKTEAETLDIIAQRSRDDSRTPMQWNSSENAGFTTGTPWIGIADNYKAINAAAEVDDPDSVRSFYKMLVHLRKTHKVISEGKIEFLYPDNADLLAYRRYGAEDGEELLVLCNLTEHDAPYTLPEGWADADKLLGNYPDRNDALRPYECLILTKA